MFGSGAACSKARKEHDDNMCISSRAVGGGAPDGLRLRRYLPLSVAVTVAVTLLPLFAVSQLGPARTPVALALHVLAAVALSILAAQLLATLWTRNRHSSDLMFGDLLLWGWARPALAERRLNATSRQLIAPDSDDARVALLQRTSALLERRDSYTHGHGRRVARHAEQTARAMGLSREQIEAINGAALVHDIGKINVPQVDPQQARQAARRGVRGCQAPLRRRRGDGRAAR